MAGIKKAGVYIPYYRLSRQKWVKAWGKDPQILLTGEKSVASFDEDPVTMGVTASISAIQDNPTGIDGLFFACSSPLPAEKSIVNLAATAIDLPGEVQTAHFTRSLRAGTSALISAWDAVKAGSLKNVLVVAGDVRASKPGSFEEVLMGDCAASLLIGEGLEIAVIKDAVSVESEGENRREGRGINFPEGEIISANADYLNSITLVLKKLFHKTGVTPERLNKIITYAPDGTSYIAAAKRSGYPHLWNGSPLLLEIGDAGTASPLVQFVNYLRYAKPGEKVVLAGYGNGADGILLEITDRIENYRGEINIIQQINKKFTRITYAQMSSWRKQLRKGALDLNFQPLRDKLSTEDLKRYYLALYGKRCRRCNMTHYPPEPLCPSCGNSDSFVYVKLKKRGKVCSVEQRQACQGDKIPAFKVTVEAEGGGKILTQMTDLGSDGMETGTEVELVLRRFYYTGNRFYYFWKARPKRF